MIMNHNKKTPLDPINTSSSKFGVMFENQFIVLDDAKHVIGVNPNDASKLIIENIETGKAHKFGWKYLSCFFITSLFYNEDTGFLYSGDDDGRLFIYKVNISSKSCERVQAYEDIGTNRISSSHRFMNFVFFGGYNTKIKVLDLSSGELFPGYLETSIRCVYSLGLCEKPI